MHVEVDRDRALRIDGVDSGLVKATDITGGGASVVRVKPEGESDVENTFDGWEVRTVTMQVLIHPREGEDRYAVLARVEAMSRQENADGVPEQHTLSGPLTDARGIGRVICLSLDPVKETSDDDGIRLSLTLEEVDPRVQWQRRQPPAPEPQAAAEEEQQQEAEQAESLATDEDRQQVETYWTGDF